MIRAISLMNGEQIIGNVEDHYENFKVFNPFYIVETINEDGLAGSKLTNVLTFSSSDYIIVSKSHVVFEFPISKAMCNYYEKLVSLYDKKSSDDIVNEALHEMTQAETRYEKLMAMLMPDRSKLN
jgi:hypothetical protein